MKKFFVFCLIGGLLCGPAVIWAGEKEELQLKREMLNERMQRILAVGEILKYQLRDSQAELGMVEQRLKELEPKPKQEEKK